MLVLLPQQPLLRPYVKQIHHFTINSQGITSMTAIPTGNVFLTLIWGSGSFVNQRPSSSKISYRQGIFISGQQFEIARHWAEGGEISVIGFELTPHAIFQFFGTPQSQITNLVLPLEDLWSNKA